MLGAFQSQELGRRGIGGNIATVPPQMAEFGVAHMEP